jgi:PDZ domain
VRYQLDHVIPALRNDRPRYFIYGPYVFSIVTQELLGRLDDDRGRYGRGALPLVSRLGDQPEFPGEEIVIVCSRAFSHPITKGYDEPFLSVVDEINGVKVKNLRHLVEILRDMTDRFVAFKFAGVGTSIPEIPVFEHTKMLAATETVITDNGIRSPYSDDIAKVWNAKP